MPPAQTALWIILGVALLVSVVTDVLSGRILDVITYPAIAIALGVRFFWEGLGDVEHGLLSGLVCSLSLMAFFALLAWRGKMGWGDVKLMGVAGAVFGYPLALSALVFTSLAGALQALVTLIWHGQVWQTLADTGRRWAIRVRLLPKDTALRPGRHIPYGVAIAVGCVWAMWWEHANGSLQ